MEKPHNIYIHVPFCAKKCKYCAFFSCAMPSPDWDEYCNRITAEIRHWAARMGRISVPTIFFGGGTPSLMPAKTFAKIMDTLRANFDIIADAEITVEANPATIDNKKLGEFCAAGANRLSVGVQSLDDDKLRFLGRIHNAPDAMKLIDIGLRRGIRVSADFIYGLPNDTLSDIVQLCDDINGMGLSHCSMYELTIEPETPFGKMNLSMPSNEEMAEMYATIQGRLNMGRYEVSNYCFSGNECRHNANVWDGEPYIGIGAGAAGRILFNGKWYEEMGAYKMFEPMTDTARTIERVITGLRTKRGVRLDDSVKKIINLEFAKSHPNMLRFTCDDRIAATDAGIMVLDDLITKLVM